MILPVGFGSSAGGTPANAVENSLRFNSADSAYLSRTLSSSGNMKVFTLSFWLKRTALGVINNLFTARNAIGSGAEYFQIKYNANDTISVIGRDSGSVVRCNVSSTAVFRDPGAWAHIVISFNASSTTLNVYANNVVIANSTSIGNVNYGWNNSSLTYHRIGDGALLGEANLNGYMAELYHVDGQALTPSSFGETDSATGVWKPKAYSGTYGTNGFYLKFADNSGTTSTTLGKDSSGNGNNWTPNNFSVTAGVGNDSLVDTPTSYGTDTGVGGEVRGNYCTMNPLQYSSTYVTLNNGNLNVTGSSGVDAGGAFGTAKVNSGKWYWEATVVAASGTYPFIGFAVNTTGTQYQGGARVNTSGTLAIASPESFITLNGSPSGTSFTTNDVLQFALDMDNGKMWIGKNGTWMNSGVPASGTGNVFSISDRTQFVSPYIFSYNSSQVAYNFGQRAFAYTAPSGFKALCTQNLPPVTIGATSTTQANDYFNPVLYTGTGSSLGVTGVGFQPDLVWIKSRSAATDHGWYDAVRGVQKQLESNTTTVETTETTGLTAFNSDGFTVGALAQLNTSSATYVAWNWNAGGSNQTISVGQYATSPANVPSIASTVRANTTSGFSIVSFAFPAVASKTVGHGLGVAPSMVIVKSRSNGTQQWITYHASSGNTGFLCLNKTDAFATNSTVWDNTSPTLTVFTLGSGFTSGNFGADGIAYCFAPVAGYSAFGSYLGNNTNDNAFVYLGFKPEFIMIKCSSTGGINYDWIMFDVARMPYNYIANTDLRANLPSAEGGTSRNPALDILSNGFKVRGSGGEIGQSQTYIYAAFAENPFKYSLAR